MDNQFHDSTNTVYINITKKIFIHAKKKVLILDNLLLHDTICSSNQYNMLCFFPNVRWLVLANKEFSL